MPFVNPKINIGASDSENNDFLFLQEKEKENEIEKTLIVIKKISWSNFETAFFIAEAELAKGEKEPLHSLAIKALNSNNGRFKIKGVSSLIAKDVYNCVDHTFEVTGDWVVDPTYGIQMNITSVGEHIPSNPEGLRKYFCSGRIRGIGAALGNALLDHFGMDLLRVLDESPERLTEIPKISPSKAKDILLAWQDKKINFALVAFLGQYGVGEGLSLKIKETLGEKNILSKIKNNPYILTEVDGIGFLKADEVATLMGFPKDSELRLQSALFHILTEKIRDEGHTAIPLPVWLEQSARMLKVSSESLKPLAQQLLKDNKVAARTLSVKTLDERSGQYTKKEMWCISPFKEVLNERDISDGLTRLVRTNKDIYEDRKQRAIQSIGAPIRKLNNKQKRGAFSAIANPVSILTGGPGTGKTTTLRTVVSVANEIGLKVVLCAPTGRAAKRMEEAIGQKSSTIHRLLGFGKAKGQCSYLYNKDNKLPGNLFVVDEASMVESSLMAALLNAIPDGAKLMIVGDPDQLPSVGPGDVLRNLIDFKQIPTTELVEIYRQQEGSSISEMASRVRLGYPPTETGHPLKDEYALVRANDDFDIISKMKGIINGLLVQGFDAKDIQVLCPEKGKDAGTDVLNYTLREILNPDHPGSAMLEDPTSLVPGERMMVVKNDYSLDVFNGDLGYILEVKDDGSIVLEMEEVKDEKKVVVFDPKTASSLQLAYARTVHKSQGGEHKCVLVPLSKGHMFSFTRSLLYTAITRAKLKLILIGDPTVAASAARKQDKNKRITGLIEEIVFALNPSVRSTARDAGLEDREQKKQNKL